MNIFKSLFTSYNLSLFEIIKHYVLKINKSQLIRKYRVKKEKDTREKRKQENKSENYSFLLDYPTKYKLIKLSSSWVRFYSFQARSIL